VSEIVYVAGFCQCGREEFFRCSRLVSGSSSLGFPIAKVRRDLGLWSSRQQARRRWRLVSGSPKYRRWVLSFVIGFGVL